MIAQLQYVAQFEFHTVLLCYIVRVSQSEHFEQEVRILDLHITLPLFLNRRNFESWLQSLPTDTFYRVKGEAHVPLRVHCSSDRHGVTRRSTLFAHVTLFVIHLRHAAAAAVAQDLSISRATASTVTVILLTRKWAVHSTATLTLSTAATIPAPTLSLRTTLTLRFRNSITAQAVLTSSAITAISSTGPLGDSNVYRFRALY